MKISAAQTAGTISSLSTTPGAASRPGQTAEATGAETLPLTPTQADQAAPEPSIDDLKSAVGDINNTIQSLVSHLEFSVDTDTGRNVVKVVDMRTHEIIRQFPSHEALAIAKALDSFQGLLLREKA
jgi:flagellar protein FlaG